MPIVFERLAIVCFAICLSAAPPTAIEISQHPEQLLSRNFDNRAVTLHGVRLGDPESKVPKADIAKREGDILYLKNGDGYWIFDGEVHCMYLNDRATLRQLRIGQLTDVQMRFGRADQIDQQLGKWHHYYFDRHLSVVWDGQVSVAIAY